MRISEPGGGSIRAVENQARMPKLEKGDVVGAFQSSADAGSHVHGSNPVEDLTVRKVLYSSSNAESAQYMLESLSGQRGDENLALVRTTSNPAGLAGPSEYHVVRLNFNPDERHASDVFVSRDAARGVSILAVGDSQSLKATTHTYANELQVPIWVL